jgi:hypothetical protein
MKKGKVAIQINSHTDFESGEVKQEQVTVNGNFESEPAYVKFYTADMLYLADIPSGLNTILVALLKKMSYDNDIFINSSLKRIIAEETGKKFETVNKSITQFVKGNILIRKDTGHYLFNPYIFGKGKWQDVKSIRVTIDYNLQGRKFSSVVETSEEE